MRNRTHKIDEIINLIKKKVEHSVSSLVLISEGMKKLVDIVKDKNKNKK